MQQNRTLIFFSRSSKQPPNQSIRLIRPDHLVPPLSPAGAFPPPEPGSLMLPVEPAPPGEAPLESQRRALHQKPGGAARTKRRWARPGKTTAGRDLAGRVARSAPAAPERHRCRCRRRNPPAIQGRQAQQRMVGDQQQPVGEGDEGRPACRRGWRATPRPAPASRAQGRNPIGSCSRLTNRKPPSPKHSIRSATLSWNAVSVSCGACR
jgi:hypothetical protein